MKFLSKENSKIIVYNFIANNIRIKYTRAISVLCRAWFCSGHTISSWLSHYSDIVMSAMASQITGVSIVCSTVPEQIKENIKAPRHWPVSGQSTGDRWFPSQRTNNAENISIWWRHHIMWSISPMIDDCLADLKTILWLPRCQWPGGVSKTLMSS